MDLPRRKHLRLEAPVYAEPGRAFSVTIGTAPRSPVFTDVDFGEECVRLLNRRCAETATRCYAYCLMPDHVHLLVGIGEQVSLSALVGSWKSMCAVARRRRGQSCRFWQRSFFDRALRDNEPLNETALYILANPIRAGLTSHVGEYPLAGSLEFEL
jgi:putative transposase